MNFAYGVIIIVGILAAISIGFIALDPNAIIEPRIVSEKPVACTMQWDPMCGVDGVTYGNSCMLDTANVKLDYSGECVVEEIPVHSGMVVQPETLIVSVTEGSGAPGCEDTNSCFSPYSLEIRVGDTVSWSNDDSAAHTVTSGSISSDAGAIFDSSLFMAGTTFEHTFDKAGTFDYFCMVHPWMTGEIIVNEIKDMMVSEPIVEEPIVEEPIVEEPIVEEVSSDPKTMAMTIVSVPPGVAVPGCENKNSCYSPYEVTISVGNTVTWSNDDSAAHTVTSGSVDAGLTGVFDSGLFASNSRFEHTFDKAGTFDYFCMVHPWMTGIVHVN